MSQRLVTIATFSFPQEAYIFKTKLESQGIQSYVADEYIVTMMWLYSLAVGGVKLKVRASDEAKAIEIISQETPVHEAKKHRASLSYWLFTILALAGRADWTILIIPAFFLIAILAWWVEWYRNEDKRTE